MSVSRCSYNSKMTHHRRTIGIILHVYPPRISDVARHTLCILMAILLFSLPYTEGQTHRNFPPLFSVAKGKPVTTTPSQSTCGIPTRTAFCKSSTFAKSVKECITDFCVQECTRRTQLPIYDIMLKASGYGTCVTADTVNRRPGSSGMDYAAVFSVGTLCYLTPLDVPTLGANGAFTLTFWMWQEAGNLGTVIEKFSTTETIFRLRISGSSLVFMYRTSFGMRETMFVDSLQMQTWTHVSVQVYDSVISYFIDGTGTDFTARGTQGLLGFVTDGDGIVRIGQARDGSDQFVGRLQDFFFFSETLTNREVDLVHSGALPEVDIQTRCRCPPTHPRVKPLHTRFCIPNGVADNVGDEVLRLNQYAHPPEYMNDGDVNSVWVSAIFDDVTITVDLTDQYQVFFVVLQFYSPLPKVVTIEKRTSVTANWEPWQFYAEDCSLAFNLPNNGPLATPTSVNCIQFGTNNLLVPYSKGNITFQILSPEPQPRPGHNDFYHTPELFELVKARQVRVRLQGHHYVDHPRHKYFGIYEYMVTGRCNCHGHAESCDTSASTYKCNCSPESNTEGNQCEKCKALYNDKPFRIGDQFNAYNCKACNCNNHASSCVYDVMLDSFPDSYDRGEGGVCVDCQHNTIGRLCENCKPMHFRPIGKSMQDVDACSPCECSSAGVEANNLECVNVGGQCSCKLQVEGRQCDRCRSGYYNLQNSNPVGCEPCGCSAAGTINGDLSCHPTIGQCNCKRNVRNRQCDACQYGFFSLDSGNPEGCSACNCNPLGALDQFCNPGIGQCVCRANVVGLQCDSCGDGFFDFAAGCTRCDCNLLGTVSGSGCNETSGQCMCKPHATGLRCDQCLDGYFNLGADATFGCISCGCDVSGTLQDAADSVSDVCNKLTGECLCKPNVQGRSCNQCKANTFNLTAANPLGCEPCGCDPSGTLQGGQMAPNQLSCDQNTGQCTCTTNRYGRRCESCIPGSYVNPVAGGGCQACSCNGGGTIGGTNCDPDTGQCQCRTGGSGITGLACDQCTYNYFGFNPARGRCELCNCDSSGSVNGTCNPVSGQCFCKEFTTQRQCGSCVPGTSELDATNPYGCTKAPSQQPPPSYEPIDSTVLRLYWGPPDYPNGVIIRYYLNRDSQVIATLEPDVMEYTDTGLTPFTDYRYYVIAENNFGTTASPIVTYRTPSGRPSGNVMLRTSNVGARTASFSWTLPQSANGVIQKYELSSTTPEDPVSLLHYQGLGMSYTVTDLVPFTNYTFHVSACTVAGCLVSLAEEVITKEALPEAQAPPNVTALSSSSFFVEWEPPLRPYGIIIFYELWMRGMVGMDGLRDPVETRLFHPAGQYNPRPSITVDDTALTPPATSYTVQDLQSYTQYEFQVISENSLGKVASPWVTQRTLESAPTSTSDPEILPVSSTELNVTWPKPAYDQTKGEVVQYRVYHYRVTDLQQNPFAPPYIWVLIGTVDGTEYSYLAAGFQPYSLETFKVEACNLIGCTNSTEASGRTLPAAPAGVSAPHVEGFNDTAMSIDWQAPANPNGPQPSYMVRCIQAAFNHPPPTVTVGTRFPGFGYYKFPSYTIPQGVGFSGFEVWFRTSARDGLILFAASEGGQEEFVALQLRAGRPWFLFDPQGCTTAVTPFLNQHEANDTFTFGDGQWHQVVVRRLATAASISIDGLYTGCAAIVTTTDDEGLPYNDNKFHKVKAMRIGKRGFITLDDRWSGTNVRGEGERDSNCATGNIIGKNTGVYVGGLPEDYILQREESEPRALVSEIGFMGCIRDLKILMQDTPEEVWNPLDWTTVIERSDANPDWEGCPTNLDTGYHFLGTGYAVGQSGHFTGDSSLAIAIEFEMRTEITNGLLLFAWGGTGTYYLAQMVGGSLALIFSNGAGVAGSVVFQPQQSVQLCDGAWHYLRLLKLRSELRIEVDFDYSTTSGDRNIAAPLAISSELYIGGVPEGSEAEQVIAANNLGNIVQKSFGGCLRSFRINRRPFDLVKSGREVRNVYMDGCPAERVSRSPCQPSLSRVIYQGTGNSTYDLGLGPFTEYMYQVEVSNEVGRTRSPWGTGRTREAPPQGLSAPTTVVVVDGFTLRATWRPPMEHTGLIILYKLNAYDRDDSFLPPVVATFNNSAILKGDITNAVPYTNYTVKLEACTYAGCTESDAGVDVFTDEEAPLGVVVPAARDVGGFHLFLGWALPAMPNGVITGYFLFMEDTIVYQGNLLEFNVTGLNVYTGYRFHVKACTRVGCTDSETVTLSTAQLAPSYVAPPRLTVLGTRRMQVEWDHPDQLNGALLMYQLYASTFPPALGDLIYNSTDLFVFYTVPDFIPGTTYYIRLGACTGGGCTLSDPSIGRTEESAPEGVPDPTVTSPSPVLLYISWGTPQFPNGDIILYRLFQNGLMVYNDSLVREHYIENLQPWSLHYLRVEACTTKGCGSSNEVSARTQEAPPEGVIGLDVQVVDARTTRLRWNSVAVPNGLVSYNVFFEGLFYVDPDNLDYSTITTRRSLHESQDADTWVDVTELIPYTSYYVQVNASNTKGFILSNTKQALMPKGSPDGVLPPVLISPSSTSVLAQWAAVGRVNADQEAGFQLQFKETTPGAVIQDIFPQPTTSNSYLKTDLTPFTLYEFRLVASNAYGDTTTPWVTITTRQDKPDIVDPPMTSEILSRSMMVTWEAPLRPNGVVVEYRVYIDGVLKVKLPGNMTSTTVDGLVPATTYLVTVEACTPAGCTRSGNSRPATTLKAAPEGIPAPSLVSQTPTSVLIAWAVPQSPNGPILQYAIERRLKGQDGITIVKTFLPSDPRQYMDESSSVVPYETYEYRIVAYNTAGQGAGPWAEITTKASRPGGVLPPIVNVLSPSVMEIRWQPPIQPNGRLESYIIKLPEPRFEIRNISQDTYTATNLIPYTQYSVTITACSEGGCTESLPTVVTTSPSVPQGQEPPVGTPHSQTYVSLLWELPRQPNGPNVRYELSRMKVAQPLEANARGFGLWASVYVGHNTYFDDRGLTMYTTYKYRVTVSNDYGHTTSHASTEVTTFGGTPTKAPLVSVGPVNHTSVGVSWITPNIIDLQGGVSEFMVNISGGNDKRLLTFDPTVTSTVIGSLQPNTRYAVTVTLVVHGGALITSSPGYATTGDGAPEGLDPPYLAVINDTTLRVSWQAPQSANGDITGYYLYLDMRRIRTGLTTPGSYLLAGLAPHTIYTVQVEVCTVYACVKSPAVQATTTESIPGQVAPPRLSIAGPSAIVISWDPPVSPNGIILRYELLRKTKVFCSNGSTTPAPPGGKCQYFECERLQSFCGSQCYSGTKTCCDGVLHENKRGYQCCGASYIPDKTNPSAICCGGKFHQPLLNHQCCGQYYVEVKPGQICCPDPTQDRVDVGYGDSCCSSVPYASSGAQICCNNRLHDKFGHQCCGKRVVSDSLVCCGNSTTGIAHQTAPAKVCCGPDYVDPAVRVCCMDEMRAAKVHTYANAEAKNAANQKCCGLERISTSLACCHGNGYNSLVQMCADRSDSEAGCGTGVVCSLAQGATAFCNRCNFNRITHKCGSYTSQSGGLQYAQLPLYSRAIDESDLCLTDAVKVYTGMELFYRDAGLSPFTQYHYAVSVINGAGTTTSDYVQGATTQSLPVGVSPPLATVEPGQLDTIHLKWDPPLRANGAILRYILFRDGIEIFRDATKMEYMDNNAIQPYQTYLYKLQVCNGAGCVESEQVKVATLQAKPELVGQPTVRAESSTVLRLVWARPGKPNGYISLYEVFEIDLGSMARLDGSAREYTLTGLKPYTEYSFIVSACTDVGCTNSTIVTGRTLQDRPQGLDAPKVVIVNVQTAEIYWKAPAQPNGVVLSYRLFRGTAGSAFQLLFQSPGLYFMYLDTGLQPTVQYVYMIEAATSAGGTNSSVLSLEMPARTPLLIPAPHTARVEGPRKVVVAWDPPPGQEMEIDQYIVVLNAGTDRQVVKGVGLATGGTITSLEPFTEYKIRVRACLKGYTNGCATGPEVSVTTFPDVPEGQASPDLTAVGPKAVRIEWEPPTSPNGIITGYRINRRDAGDTRNGILVMILDRNDKVFTNVDPQLMAFQEYEYRVTAVNTVGSSPSPWARVRTLAVPPQSIGGPAISNIGAYSVTLSWQPPQQPNGNIAMYKIQFRPVLSDPTSQLLTKTVTVPGTVTTTSISGLAPFLYYEVRVTAFNAAGNVSSPWIRARTQEAAPADIGPFSVEKMTDGRAVILKWEMPGLLNGIVSNFLIYEEGNINAIYQGLSMMFEYRRLEPYTAYTVQLEACTGGGCGRSPRQTFLTAEVAPSNQPAPTLAGANATTVVLRWHKPLNANGKVTAYDVLRRVVPRRQKRDTLPSGDYQVIGKVPGTDQEEYEFTDSNVEPYKAYEYKIRATNSKGYTDSPAQIVQTPQAPPTGVAPPIVSHSGNKFDELLIRWVEPVTANGVILNYQLKRNDTIPRVFAPTDPKEYRDTGLTAYTLYSYTIEVCTGGGCTTSAATVFRTQESKPLFVLPPKLTSLSATSITASWETPQITNGQIRSYHLKVDDTVVYSGPNKQYTISNLVPFQAYTFVVSACTFGGCTDSSGVIGRPAEAPPEGLQQPVLLVLSSTSIEITWQPPSNPHGLITEYELRRDGFVIYETFDASSRLSYTDNLVGPGREYSYTVTVFNSKGSVTSATSTAKTYSSSPQGLQPPTLVALTDTSVRASWKPPLQANGQIISYTLTRGTKEEYSGLLLEYVVHELTAWTEYSLRVQACTSHGCATSDPAYVTTKQGLPLGMDPPRLTPMADSTGAHSGVNAQWAPPRLPNGVITKYELYRQDSPQPGIVVMASSPRKLLYSGQDEQYLDTDPSLKPFSSYQYLVICYNTQGQATSAWQTVQTREAPPVGVPAPTVKGTTHSTITIEFKEPERPNGNIQSYKVYLNGSLIAETKYLSIILGEDHPLSAFTIYALHVEACTSGGCTASPVLNIRTQPIKPQGMAPPTVTNITTTAVDVTWSMPLQPNGPIVEYEMSYRRTCPHPYADADDPVTLACETEPWASQVKGTVFSAHVAGLQPYTRYEFQVQVRNQAGGTETPNTTLINTLPFAPMYSSVPPTLRAEGNVIVVDWAKSFFINAEVKDFMLFVDGRMEYNGHATKFNVIRETRYETYEFQVRLETTMGTANTPKLFFDPTKPDYVEPGTKTTIAPVPITAAGPWYQEVWFIVVMAILALIILLIGIALCIRKTNPHVPYIRERMPLEPRQKKALAPLAYSADPYEGGPFSDEYPHPPLSHMAHSDMPHVGYINPGFSSLSRPHSRAGSLMDLNLDKLSHKGSTKWDDDEDWDRHSHAPRGNDSGLHSLAYGDDYDGDSDRPISVLKEHTMFTDTHL